MLPVQSTPPHTLTGIRRDQLPVIDHEYPEGVEVITPYDLATELTESCIAVCVENEEGVHFEELSERLLGEYMRIHDTVTRLHVGSVIGEDGTREIDNVCGHAEANPGKRILIRYRPIVYGRSPLAHEAWSSTIERMEDQATEVPIQVLLLSDRDDEVPIPINTQLLVEHFTRLSLKFIDPQITTQMEYERERYLQSMREEMRDVVSLSASESLLPAEEPENSLRILTGEDGFFRIIDISMQNILQGIYWIGKEEYRHGDDDDGDFYNGTVQEFINHLREQRRKMLFATGRAWRAGIYPDTVGDVHVPPHLIPLSIEETAKRFQARLLGFITSGELGDKARLVLEKEFEIELKDEMPE